MAKAPMKTSRPNPPLGTLRSGQAWTLIIQPLVGEYRADDLEGRVARVRRSYVDAILHPRKKLLESLRQKAGFTHLVLWLDGNDLRNERDKNLTLILERVAGYLESVAAGSTRVPFYKVELDGADGRPIGGGLVLLREDAVRWALRSCGSKALAEIAKLPIENIDEREQLAVYEAIKSLKPKALRSFVESCIGTEPTPEWPASLLEKGLGRLLEGIEERHARILEIAGIMNAVARHVASEDRELMASAASEVPGDDLVKLGAFFQDAAKRRYHEEVFGGGRSSISGFNAWLREESQRQAKNETSDERKRFVANVIQHFLREQDWRLKLNEEGVADVACTVATGPYRFGRKYYIRERGSEQRVITARSSLPVLQANA